MRSVGDIALNPSFQQKKRVWAIPVETAGNGKDNVKKKVFQKCAINVVKAVQMNFSNAYMKLQSMN